MTQHPPSAAGPTGRFIGPWLVREEVGRGAMGVVYRVQNRGIGPSCALKVLLPEALEDEMGRERFKVEVTTMRRLGDHPGIVTVVDYGETKGRLPYYVMEFIEGETFRQAVKSGLPDGEAIDLLIQVADALGYAHQQFYVHRDVKPDNVIVTGDGRALLTDFGIARILGGLKRLTRTGDLLGTPVYMAPELANPTIAEAGPPADVWALGCMLYEIFTKRPPYLGKTAVAVFTKLLQGAHYPSVRSLRPGISPEIEQVIVRALEPTPGDRYPNADAFAADLRAAVAAGPLERAPRKKLSLKLIVAAVLLLAVAVGGAMLAGSTGDPEIEDSTARLQELFDEGKYGDVVAQGRKRLESKDLDDDVRRETRVLVLRSLYRQGSVAEAHEGVRAWDGHPEFEDLVWILALNGQHAEAAALPGHAYGRARVAAWAGDRDAYQKALGELPEEHALALRWELCRYFPDLTPSPSSLPQEVSGWAAIAQGEEALARGSPALAHIAFGSVKDGEGPIQLAAMLGLARAYLARWDLTAAAEVLTQALPLTTRHLDVLPLARARWLEIAAAVTVANQDLRGRMLLDPLESAKRQAPHAPGVLRARWTADLSDRPSGGLAQMAQSPPHSAGTLSEARRQTIVDARAGLDALLRQGSLSKSAQECFSLAELAHCERGADGPVGIALARFCRLATAAESGRRRAAERARAGLTAVLRLRPESPAAWIGLARACLVLHDAKGAREAAGRALALAPDDGQARLVAAHAAATALEGKLIEVELQRLAGDRQVTNSATSLYRSLEPVVEAYQQAQAALPQRGRLGRRAALGYARWNLVRLRCARLSPSAREQVAELTKQVDALLDPFLVEVPVEQVLEARGKLRTALSKNRADEASKAEVHLADLARRITRVHLEALLLRSQLGDARARSCTLTFIALAGDLPARAILRARRIEAAGQKAEGREALEPWVKDFNLDVPYVSLRYEELGPLGRDPGSLIRLAAVVSDGPELVARVLRLLSARKGSAQERQEWSSLIDRELKTTREAKSRSKLFLARALADRAARLPTSRGARASDAIARRAYLDVTEAARLWPGAGAWVLRALTLSQIEGHDPADVVRDLELSRAAAPWAWPALLAYVQARPRDVDLRDALQALGFCDLPWVTPSVQRMSLQDPEETWTVFRDLGNAPNTRLSLLLHLLNELKSTEARESGAKTILDEQILEHVDEGLRTTCEAVFSFHSGQSKELHSAALRGVVRSSPGGRLLELRPWHVRAPGVRAPKTESPWDQPSRAALWPQAFSLRQGSTSLASLALSRTSAFFLGDLADPWSGSQALLHTLQGPNTHWAVEFLLTNATTRRTYKEKVFLWQEALMAIDRRAVFQRSANMAEAYYTLAQDTLRRQAYGSGPIGNRWSGRLNREMDLLVMAYTVLERAAQYAADPALIYAAQADVALDMTGWFMINRDNERVTEWLQKVQAAMAKVPRDLETPLEQRVYTRWRWVRYGAVMGNQNTVRQALRDLRLRSPRTEVGPNREVFVRGDPLRLLIERYVPSTVDWYRAR